MTPIELIRDLLSTIPEERTDVPEYIMAGLRRAASDGVDDQMCVSRLLATLRPIVHQHLIRCEIQEQVEASGGKVHPRSTAAIASARELLASVDARLGVDRD